MKQIRGAFADLVRGAKLWPFYTRLGFDDIRQRYVRTAIGPLWMLINSAVWIVALAFISASLFGQDISKAFPMVAAGMYAWLLFSACLSEGSHVFLNHSWLLTTSTLPLSFHIYRHLVRIALTFTHYIPILLGVLLLCGVVPTWRTLMLVPALLNYLILALWLGVILGILALRFRDVPHAVTTVASVLPMVSPIAWSRDLLKQHYWLADFNPVYHYIEIFRSAALSQPIPATSWLATLAINLVGLIAAGVLFSQKRMRLALWV
jgi:ABC-type polysaccharide/polyol phosphate export permease